ncbi:MAG: threonylcarbamoyl-AMP synthase, partial [Candidatus Omnitrophica bacterium]|nr:threonylcarbamoyl-AMP synthase [Candidatus Omnitrophota bacterium]
MSVIKIDPIRPDKKIIASAAKAIKEGKLVAFPTETVYGIAANLLDKEAIEKLYAIKARPKTKPLTVHISDIKMIEALGCILTKEAKILIKKFWPGPLTVILESPGNKTIGFRMPANKVALDLISAAGVPVVSPSANLSGMPAPTSAEEVVRNLEDKIDMVLDSGHTDVGVESTVIDLTVKPPKILREGAIRIEELQRVLKIQNPNTTKSKINPKSQIP